MVREHDEQADGCATYLVFKSMAAVLLPHGRAMTESSS